MKKILYLLILGALFLAPVERLDVAKLLPIRAVALYMQGERVVLETDTAHMGSGVDAMHALESLKKNTPAVIYLDTAEYLLVSEAAQAYVEQLRGMLKPSVKVCICDAAGKVKIVAEYLDVHGSLTELRHWGTKTSKKK